MQGYEDMRDNGEHPGGDLLHGYVDGMLSEHERLEVEAYLTRHPAAAERVAEYRRQKDRLHDAYDPWLADENLPEPIVQLERRLQRRLSGKRPVRRLARAATLAVVALVSLAGGYYGAIQLYDPEVRRGVFALLDQVGSLADTAVQSLEPPADVVPVESSAGDAGAGDTATGKTMSTPDLTERGFDLVASRVVQDENGVETVQLTYESGESERILLYFSPAREDQEKRQISLNQEGPVSILSWSGTGRSYSMIGENVGREDMLALGKLINQRWPGRGTGDGSGGQPETDDTGNGDETAGTGDGTENTEVVAQDAV